MLAGILKNMNNSITFQELIEVSTLLVKDLGILSDKYPNLEDVAACEDFSRRLVVLEGVIRTTYAVSVTIARESHDLHQEGEIFKGLRDFFDLILNDLNCLREKHSCEEFYDFVQSYRQAAHKRYEDFCEMIDCEAMDSEAKDFLAGLFPKID